MCSSDLWIWKRLLDGWESQSAKPEESRCDMELLARVGSSISNRCEMLMFKNNLTGYVQSPRYTLSAGVGGRIVYSGQIVQEQLYPFGMILEADMDIEQIDEALHHLSESIRISISEARRNALLDLVDALLDAKLEKAADK